MYTDSGVPAKNVLYYTGMDPVLGVEKSARNSKILIIGAILVGLAIIVGLLWYFLNPTRRESAQVAELIQEQLEEQGKTNAAVEQVVSPPALSGENVTPETNTVEGKVPEVNPVERANPFAEEFENPFE